MPTAANFLVHIFFQNKVEEHSVRLLTFRPHVRLESSPFLRTYTYSCELITYIIDRMH